MLWKECVDGLHCWLPHTLSNEASLWLHSHLIQARMTIAAKFTSPPNTNTHIHPDSYGCSNGICHQCSGWKKMENCFRTDRSDAAASDASSDFSKPNQKDGKYQCKVTMAAGFGCYICVVIYISNTSDISETKSKNIKLYHLNKSVNFTQSIITKIITTIRTRTSVNATGLQHRKKKNKKNPNDLNDRILSVCIW